MAVDPNSEAPESSAARTALWRALHVEADASPHVIEDVVGLTLLAPDDGWRARPDMDVQGTRFNRASIVARARFIEDLIVEETARGVTQYVLLGAGLDSFVQRRPEIASHLSVFEVDLPGPQAWKRRRLMDLGYGLSDGLKFVAVDFEKQSWWDRLVESGFDTARPAVVASTGVSLYLSREAIEDMLRKMTTLASGSTFVMTFILPMEMANPEERPSYEASIRGARASGTPFISFFSPDDMLAMARKAGFKDVRCIQAAELTSRYFVNRSDNLRPGSEALLVAAV